MKTVFGLVELRSGKIQFDGSDISRFSLLIVEQNAQKSLAVSHRGYVLEMGKNRFECEGQSLLTNKEVSALYLGDLTISFMNSERHAHQRPMDTLRIPAHEPRNRNA